MNDAGPKKVRKIRSPHGTRVSRRITCAACGAEDRVDFAPRDPAFILCRKCAFERLGVRDGDESALRSVEYRCAECAIVFRLDKDLEDPSAALCENCLRGIAIPRSHRLRTARRTSKRVVRIDRGSG